MRTKLNTLLEGVDFFIYLMNLPPKIYSLVTPNSDGTFSIYLDPRRSYLQRRNDLEHELNHIRRGDLYNGLPLYQIEDYL